MKLVQIEAGLLKQIRAKSSAERRVIGKRIAEIQEIIGQPHLHKGAGLRKLRDQYFEARIGLQTRIVFENSDHALIFEFMGNHDQVRRFLKGR